MNKLAEFSIGNEVYSIPDDRYYARETHLWAKFDPASGFVKIGIDALGLAALGDLAYVTLLPAGLSLHRGKALGTLEAAKMTGGLASPVSGEIVARNDDAIRDPGLVNRDPYHAGWLVAIRPTDWQNESAMLISGEKLPPWVDAELERYRLQGWVD